MIGVACHLLASLAAEVAPHARLAPLKLVALAGCIAGLAINLLLVLVRWRVLYLVPIALFGAVAARLGWELAARHRTERGRFAPLFAAEVPRLIVLGVAMLLAAMPVWLPLLVDYDGFGGFPHRVNDEVGPGFNELMRVAASRPGSSTSSGRRC